MSSSFAIVSARAFCREQTPTGEVDAMAFDSRDFLNKKVRKLNPLSFLLLASVDADDPTARGQFGAAREPILPG